MIENINFRYSRSVGIISLGLFIFLIFKKSNIKGNFQKIFTPFTKKKYFFSYSELIFYKTLKTLLNENFIWYEIFPKVRLADIFEANSQGTLNKIRAKHIDYLIVDSKNNYTPTLALELNWNSHNSFKMKKSDNFKKEIFKENNIPLFSFYNREANNKVFINKILNHYLLKKKSYTQKENTIIPTLTTQIEDDPIASELTQI